MKETHMGVLTMKNRIAILIMALLMISAVPALALLDIGANASAGASANSNGNAKAGLKAEADSDYNNDEDTAEAETRTNIGLGLGIGSVLKTKGSIDALVSKRSLLDVDVRAHEENYQKAVLKSRIILRDYKEARAEFLKTKSELKSCNGESNEKCQELDAEAIASAKAYLGLSADAVVEHLTKIREKLASEEYVDAEVLAKVTADIDAMISETMEIKAKIQTAETKEEINSYAKELNKIVVENKSRIKLYSSLALHAELGGLMHSVNNLNVKLENIGNYVDEKNIEVENWDELVAEYNAELEAAVDAYAEADAEFKEAKILRAEGSTEAEAKASVEAAVEAMHEAQAHLRATHRTLTTMITEVSEAGVNVEAAANANAEGEVQ